MKRYWEIIADNLKKGGWSLGYVSAMDGNGQNDLDCRCTPRRKAFRCGGIGESLDCLLLGWPCGAVYIVRFR